MRVAPALASGFIGAAALSLLHESVRHLVPHAPRIDVLGQRALARLLNAAEQPVPGRTGLYVGSLLGEIASNSLYYAAVGAAGKRNALTTGALLGVAAGLGAVTLPEPLGLGEQPGAEPPLTQALTVAWYTLGGVAAGAAYQRLA